MVHVFTEYFSYAKATLKSKDKDSSVFIRQGYSIVYNYPFDVGRALTFYTFLIFALNKNV